MTKKEKELMNWGNSLPNAACKKQFLLDATAMRRDVIAQERERCAKYIETKGRGKCISDDSAKALAAAIREGK